MFLLLKLIFIKIDIPWCSASLSAVAVLKQLPGRHRMPRIFYSIYYVKLMDGSTQLTQHRAQAVKKNIFNLRQFLEAIYIYNQHE